MSTWGNIAGGYLQEMPRIDRRNQLALENERADLKQKMWLAQQKRIQDQYEQAQKERAANRYLATHQGLMKDYQNFVGPPDPQMQQVLDYASPQNITASENYKTDAEKLLETLGLYGAKKRIDQQYATPAKPGTDVLSLFKRMHGRMPKDNQELFAWAQGLKGKSGQNMTLYDANGNRIFTMGDGSQAVGGQGIPAPLTPGAKTTMQKEHQGQVGLTDSLDYIIGNLQPKYFDRWEQAKMEAKKFAEKTPGLNTMLDKEDKDEIADYSSAKAGMGKTLVDMVKAASGKQVTDKEREFIKKSFAITEDDSYNSAVGKIVNLYNMLSKADARYRAISSLNGGAPPTQDQIYAWQYSTEKPKREALLKAYGYKEVTKDYIRKKMGANLKKKTTTDDLAKKYNL